MPLLSIYTLLLHWGGNALESKNSYLSFVDSSPSVISSIYASYLAFQISFTLSCAATIASKVIPYYAALCINEIQKLTKSFLLYQATSFGSAYATRSASYYPLSTISGFGGIGLTIWGIPLNRDAVFGLGINGSSSGSPMGCSGSPIGYFFSSSSSWIGYSCIASFIWGNSIRSTPLLYKGANTISACCYASYWIYRFRSTFAWAETAPNINGLETPGTLGALYATS